MGYAILKGKEVIEISDLNKWSKQFEIKNRSIGRYETEDILVSTVFLGVNHSFGFGPKLWFETMIFGGENDLYQERYSTYEEAEKGHELAVELVKKELGNR